MEENRHIKSGMLFDVINASGGFYSLPVQPAVRSRINVPFRIALEGQFSQELEARFLKEGAERGLIALKGHRSVGGLRASLYNAVTIEQTKRLAEFMREFMAQNKK